MADDYEVNPKMLLITTLTLTGVGDLEKDIHPHILSKEESQAGLRNNK